MMSTFAFMVSTIFRNSALAIGIAIFLMMAGNQIVFFLSEHAWAKYILFANTDLSQYAAGSEPIIVGMTLSFSIGMLLLYYSVFMILSWVFFTKRDVAGDRKSTRLNSSHVAISYAVFCLKKKIY